RDQIRCAVARRHRLENLLGRGLHVGGQIAVVAVLLVDLRDLIGGDAVAHGQADTHGLGVRGRAAGVVDVGLLRPDAEDCKLLPGWQDSQSLVLDTDDTSELSDHAAFFFSDRTTPQIYTLSLHDGRSARLRV